MTFQERLKRSYEWCVRRSMGHSVVYHHVPKCAGRTVNRAFRLRYFLSQSGLDSGASREACHDLLKSHADTDLQLSTDRFRTEFLLYQLHAGTRCVVGHFRFSERAFSQFADRYCFVSVLREPISRFLSHYFYSVDIKDYSRISMTLEEFVQSPDGRRSGSIYAEFFSGLPIGSDFASPEAIRLAKANLEHLHLLGFVDDLSGFARRLSRLLGVWIRFGWENRARVPTSNRRRNISPDMMKRIEECCQPDIEIHEFARSLH